MAYFEHIGPHVPYGEVYISPEEAEQFRVLSLEGTKIHKLSMTDTDRYMLTASYASAVLALSAIDSDDDVPESAFISKSMASNDPDMWRSKIAFARYKSSTAQEKIYNFFEVESNLGEVTIATRTVRVVRHLTRIAFDEYGNPYDETYSRQNKSFQIPMQPGDVAGIETKIGQVMQRQRVLSQRTGG